MNLQHFIQQHRHQHIMVGLSGGVDSVVLLHLLAQARDAVRLSAVHVHHGLSVYADDWADFCVDLCARWQIPLTVERVQVRAQGLGWEAAARVARYAVYRALPCDCLALAHHQDDQVETFFLAALRGSGVRGLAAMAAESVSGSLKVVRPLLTYARTEIERYAAQHQLPHIHDDSNDNTDLLRNWLRQSWLPELHRHLPHATHHLITAIANVQDELALINEINQLDEASLYQQQQFNIATWQTLSPMRRRQQLIAFAKRHQLGTPRRASVLAFERALLAQASGATWHLPHGVAVAYRGVLFALCNDWQHRIWQRPYFSGSLKQIATDAHITWQRRPMGLPDTTWQEMATIRPAQSGDVIALKSGHKSIKKIFQEQHIPPFLRPHYPVIVNQMGVCLAVVGLAVNQRIMVANGVWPECAALQPFLLKNIEQS